MGTKISYVQALLAPFKEKLPEMKQAATNSQAALLAVGNNSSYEACGAVIAALNLLYDAIPDDDFGAQTFQNAAQACDFECAADVEQARAQAAKATGKDLEEASRTHPELLSAYADMNAQSSADDMSQDLLWSFTDAEPEHFAYYASGKSDPVCGGFSRSELSAAIQQQIDSYNSVEHFVGLLGEYVASL